MYYMQLHNNRLDPLFEQAANCELGNQKEAR
jgi:hypothetical protein